jgi:hypothetical protein
MLLFPELLELYSEASSLYPRLQVFSKCTWGCCLVDSISELKNKKQIKILGQPIIVLSPTKTQYQFQHKR